MKIWFCIRVRVLFNIVNVYEILLLVIQIPFENMRKNKNKSMLTPFFAVDGLNNFVF